MLQGMESGRETAAPFLPSYHFCLHLPQRLGQTDFHSVSIKNPSVDHDYPARSVYFQMVCLAVVLFRGNAIVKVL